jgi:hypothetical protein
VSDNCPNANRSLLSPAFPPGATFPIGSTLVQWRGIDGSGQSADCAINITVFDDQAPVFGAPFSELPESF